MARIAVFAIAALLTLSACASAPPVPSSSERMAAVAPMLSVERFLQAANTGDLQAMAMIFGTARGPIASEMGNTFSCAFKKMGSWVGLGERCLTWQEVELRMDLIANILRHDDFRVRSEANVAGRLRPTARVLVDIQRGANVVPDVPFVVVQSEAGRWLVEEIALERLTAAAERPEGVERLASRAER